mmetsp:Transcript_10831/g.17339  ORF Transcript_10831/g.17339 Transcript_10831/m.17339 type:complete len:108 (+) Transcript_10831:2498-2821(+)
MMPTIDSKASFEHPNSQDDQQDMVQLARGLRRLKRRLLLEHAGVSLPSSLAESTGTIGLVRSTSESTEVSYPSSSCHSPSNMTPVSPRSVIRTAGSPGAATSLPSME